MTNVAVMPFGVPVLLGLRSYSGIGQKKNKFLKELEESYFVNGVINKKNMPNSTARFVFNSKNEANIIIYNLLAAYGTRWPSGMVPDLRSRGRGFESHPRLLCTNANSACHPSGVG